MEALLYTLASVDRLPQMLETLELERNFAVTPCLLCQTPSVLSSANLHLSMH
jgi:hypothetical protein